MHNNLSFLKATTLNSPCISHCHFEAVLHVQATLLHYWAVDVCLSAWHWQTWQLWENLGRRHPDLNGWRSGVKSLLLAKSHAMLQYQRIHIVSMYLCTVYSGSCITICVSVSLPVFRLMFVWKKGPCHRSQRPFRLEPNRRCHDASNTARFVFNCLAILGGARHLSKELFKWKG